jgi:preprotein translocase subunit SecG
MAYLSGFLSIVYVCSCFFLIFVVLIQKGEGGGLGGAFGGGAVDVAFGSTADTTWKKATSIAAGLFIVLSIVLGLLEAPGKSAVSGSLGSANKKADEKKPAKKADEKKPAKKADEKKPAKKADEKKPAKKADEKKPAKKAEEDWKDGEKKPAKQGN